MKLRNKKTGEIVEWFNNTDGVFPNSLTELNEEWEDYEEPKEYWFINDLDGKPMKCELRYCRVRDFTEWFEKRKQIGNYFSSQKEAEKAVEKLKAAKRLKDKCNFRFTGIEQDEVGMLKGVKVSYDRKNVTFSEQEELIKCLMLLFGGEDEQLFCSQR